MKLAPQLRSLVHESVSILGQVIENELGRKAYSRIESIRKQMAELRGSNSATEISKLSRLFRDLDRLGSDEQTEIARSFTLMLELINACENAYRSLRLSFESDLLAPISPAPEAITYVLTAHPTEARSPENIFIFHQIQNLLLRFLYESHGDAQVTLSPSRQNSLLHLLELAWRIPIVRQRKPQVKDEAEHIYSMLFRDGILFSLLEHENAKTPFYVRTWVGGDKDGHPGVNEKVMLESLTLSRQHLLKLFHHELQTLQTTLELFPAKELSASSLQIKTNLSALKSIGAGDGKRLLLLRSRVHLLRHHCQESIGSQHPSLIRLCQLLQIFPALVVPLELRESSDLLVSAPAGSKSLAIVRMLAKISVISKGGDPRWYARGLIISMTESLAHIRMAAAHQKKIWGAIRLPIIPLFEEAKSLREADEIVREMLEDRELLKAIRNLWDGRVEMMVGYSDSSKESGALASRLAIAEALPKLEKVCERKKVIPVFFHGSGGSVDRGGGSIEEQTAWWPHSALERYKVTVQGEMVERSLATPEIAKRQLDQIIQSASLGLRRKSRVTHAPALDGFAKRISAAYHHQITSDQFLEVVEAATPYSYLNILKIGSRPAKRTQKLTVAGLRAIPWVLCWTQTRVLFQTWWGVGSAWQASTVREKSLLRKAFREEPVFQSYVKALGFTLAKVELPVWKIYLQQSSLTPEEQDEIFSQMQAELEKTRAFFHQLTGEKELLWFRPWLGESILLRSSMIHPLNLLQVSAKKRKRLPLLRLTVTGISSGMLTTG
jgi:phosphoenolpyruvate carboxylase